MHRKAVKSSNIKSIGYDKETSTLEIAFNTGKVYQYNNVPESVYTALMSAESKGKYFNAHIRNNPTYPYRQV